jgi:hypothetical protein
MKDVVKKVTYFAMDIPNKPGEGARILGTLADKGVNLMAFSGFPSGRKAQIDLIPEKTTVFKNAVKASKIRTRTAKVGFLVQGKDRKGAVADLLNKLAQKKINVTAINAISAGAKRYAAILWVKPGDINKASKALGAR